MRERHVGRPVPLKSSIDDARVMQRTMNRLRGFALVPRGVYRFRTFAEADTWMTLQMTKLRARRKLKI